MIVIGSAAASHVAPKLMTGGTMAPHYNGKQYDEDFIGEEEEYLSILDYISSCSAYPTYSSSFINRNEKIAKFIAKPNFGTLYTSSIVHPIIEFDLTKASKSNQILQVIVESSKRTRQVKFYGIKTLIPDINILFTLKKSHRFAKDSPHFWKTAYHYHMMKAAGCRVPKEAEVFLAVREEETYKNTTPRLNVSKETFFTDNVNYKYDHDDIHEAVKLDIKPAYTLYKGEDEEVMCDKKKFFAISEQERLNGVLEECYVLALERSQIPHPGVLTPKQSFFLALSKVCTSITGGWFREYAYENIFNVIAQYSDDYITKFELALANNRVKDHGKSS